MTDYEGIKPFLLVTIIAKVTIDLIISFYYLSLSMYFFAFAYLIFNILIIGLIIIEKKEDLKNTIILSIISDQAYSFFLGLFFTRKIYELVFFYPTTSLLYFMGVETFIKSRNVLIITTFFTFLFFCHACYIIMIDNRSITNYGFLILFAVQIIFMVYKITLMRVEK